MRIDVLLGEARPAPADVADQVVIVIDVLRAATTVATALANGARVVVPFESVDDTRRAAGARGRNSVRTAGERAMVRIDGFDLGNSPLEYTPDIVRDMTILFTTTNGTAALVATQQARASFFAAFVNAGATVESVVRLLDGEHAPIGIAIVCAGTDGVPALEDVVCAGRLVRELLAKRPQCSITDRARIALLAERPYIEQLAPLAADAVHAHSLVRAGFAADVTYCFAADTIPVAVRFHAGQLAPADRRPPITEMAPGFTLNSLLGAAQVN